LALRGALGTLPGNNTRIGADADAGLRPRRTGNQQRIGADASRACARPHRRPPTTTTTAAATTTRTTTTTRTDA
jgi:hypothetical protein